MLYFQRTEVLISNKIALWDVLQYCNRKGNLDSKIRNEVNNDFETFFRAHRKIKIIFFNGQKAQKYFTSSFKYLIQNAKIETAILPSTSPSFSLNTFVKLKRWREEILKALKNSYGEN